MHAEKIAIGKFDYTRKLQLLFIYKQGTFASNHIENLMLQQLYNTFNVI